MKTASAGMGNRLRAWREKTGWTLDEIGGLVGVTKMYVSMLERGERELSPKAKVIFSRQLGIPIRKLFPVAGANTIVTKRRSTA